MSVVLHYQHPENYMVFGLEHVTGTTMQPRLMRRKDGDFGTIATGSNFTLASGNRVRVAIKDDPGNSALKKASSAATSVHYRLRFFGPGQRRIQTLEGTANIQDGGGPFEGGHRVLAK